MGAIHFSIDENMLKMFSTKKELEVFVETGTYKGDAIGKALPYFREIHSVEMSPAYYESARQRFAGDQKVHLYLGDSAAVLGDVQKSLRNKVVCYWLDAHWCADENTAGAESQCPLLGELAAIGKIGAESIVLIDDARFFLSPPPAPHACAQWPSLEDVLVALRKLSQTHRIMVVDDVFVYHPASLSEDLTNYAHRHGADWLDLAAKGREHDNLLEALLSKDHDLGEKTAQLEQKEAVLRAGISELAAKHAEVKAYKALAEDRQVLFQKMEAVRAELHVRYEKELQMLQTIAAEKERVIGNLQLVVEQKQEVIASQKRMLDRRIAGMAIDALGAIRKRTMAIKLGVLQHHPPKPLVVPEKYARRTPTPRRFPKVSIVTPSYNQGAYIEQTLRSVLEQSYPDLEYIVMDGGSKDDTVTILKRYGEQLSHWQSESDGGQSNALNEGFKKTTGDIMYYINSDDLLLPGAIHYVVDYFNRHPKVDVVYGHRILIDENGNEIGRWVMPGHDGKVLSWADYVPQETMFWRRGIWERAGGQIDTSFKFAMDWDLILRFREAGAVFKRLPRFLGAFRVHPQQKSIGEIEENGVPEMTLLRKRCLGREVCLPEIKKHLRSYMARHLLLHKCYRLGLLRY